ncbi:MAG: hypothetical protein NTX48_12910 [Planctomycetales bacterium]|nr:hypothetical protein [Planctomycetales bacterium]
MKPDAVILEPWLEELTGNAPVQVPTFLVNPYINGGCGMSRVPIDQKVSGVEATSKEPSGVWLALLFVVVVILIFTLREWQDGIVLWGLLLLVGRSRRIYAISIVLLFTVSFPPYSWPTSWFCLGPMMWMWRDQAVKLSRLRITAEAIAIGFTMGWTSTGFVRAGLPAFGELVHAAACLVFSLQFLAVAVAIRILRNQQIVVAAVTTAAVAVGGELLEAWLGVSWSVSNFALTVGATPLAQWSRWITPFGVAGLLYFVNFLLSPDRSERAVGRWMGPAIGVGVIGAAWYGGALIAANTYIVPLSFSALLVQPHLKVADNEPWRPWLKLDQLTRASMVERSETDLIVWPESCISASWSDEQELRCNDMATQLTVQDFSRLLTPVYRTNCLVGVVIGDRGTTQRYGLTVVEVRRYNCGCLVSKSGDVRRHDKLDLVPFMEGIPALLDTQWMRNHVLPALQINQPLNYGRNYAPLSFRDVDGREHSIAVSVCYESWLPWLAQYRDTTVDAIIHLVYDGNTANHPGMMERQIRACQFRAIETRKWNLVCSTWAGTSIIDPTGRIVRQLPPVAGVLRTDTL